MTRSLGPPTPGRGDAAGSHPARAAAAVLIAVLATLTGWYCLQRERFNLGSESDFLGRFVPEAQRLLSGGPLLVDIHLPGYAVALAGVERLVGDWLASGLLLSWLPSVVVLLCCWRLFDRIGGGWAGLGAVGLLATSTVFLGFSAQASSDMLFLAAFFGCLLAVVRAMESSRWTDWALGGLLAGLTFMLRTNGIVLLVLALAPWLVPASHGVRLKFGLMFAAGAMLPIAAWALLAQQTGSPMFPTETHSNLALTYYGDRGTAPHDQRMRLGEAFDSTLDVLLHDPIYVARIYLVDLLKLPARIVLHAGWPPLALLSALCLLYLAPWLRSRAGIVVLVIALLSTLLMNMKQFESRYYLYLTPLLGAALGVVLQRWQASAALGRRVSWLLAGLVVAIVAGMVPAALAARAMAEPPEESREIAAVVAVVEKNVPRGRPIVARKNLVTFYADRPLIWFPEAVTLDELCKALRRDLAPLYGAETIRFFQNRGCKAGSYPPLHEAFGIPALADDGLILADEDEIYFDGGSGDTLVGMRNIDFRSLLSQARWEHFAVPADDLDSLLSQQAITPQNLTSLTNRYTPAGLREGIEAITELPVMPQTVQQILILRAHSTTSARDILRIVERDPSLAAQVVYWARSPLHGHPVPGSSALTRR